MAPHTHTHPERLSQLYGLPTHRSAHFTDPIIRYAHKLTGGALLCGL